MNTCLAIENIPGEEWRELAGHDGIYFISNYGRVKSVEHLDSMGRKWPTKILRQRLSKGYPFVYLTRNANRPYGIHQLVGRAFIPNPENKPTINHINGIKTDNRIENLEWATTAEQNRHKFLYLNPTIRVGVAHKNSKLNDAKVIEIRQKYATGDFTMKKLAVEYNVGSTTIFWAIKKSTWKHV